MNAREINSTEAQKRPITDVWNIMCELYLTSLRTLLYSNRLVPTATAVFLLSMGLAFGMNGVIKAAHKVLSWRPNLNLKALWRTLNASSSHPRNWFSPGGDSDGAGAQESLTS